jgi:hypothetical protein
MPCLYNKIRFSATKTIKNDKIKYKSEPVIRIIRYLLPEANPQVLREAQARRGSEPIPEPPKAAILTTNIS